MSALTASLLLGSWRCSDAHWTWLPCEGRPNCWPSMPGTWATYRSAGAGKRRSCSPAGCTLHPLSSSCGPRYSIARVDQEVILTTTASPLSVAEWPAAYQVVVPLVKLLSPVGQTFGLDVRLLKNIYAGHSLDASSISPMNDRICAPPPPADRTSPRLPAMERPISSKKVALLLREFGIVPQDITLDGKRHANGYRREQFEDAWKRYPGDTSTPKTDELPGSPSSIFGSSDHHLESVGYVGSEVRPDTPGNELQNSHKQLKTEADPKIRRLATPAHEFANSRGEGPSDTEAGAGADDNGFPDLPSEFGKCPKPAPEPPALNGDDRIVF